MKKVSAVLSLAALCAGLCAADAGPLAPSFRQVYTLDQAKVKVYTQQFEKDLDGHADWKNAPAFYYVVPPLSDVIRRPDTYPTDGTVLGTIRIAAALGEFEPASIVVAPRKNVDKFILQPSALKSAEGATIPADALDVKIVKCWYQSGAAWYGYFADALGRVLVPELLVNDENLVHVADATKDNYVRYSNEDQSISYQWMSANFMVTDYQFVNQANIGLIADAETLQPAVLNTNEFKQFFITVKVPQDAKAGLYNGKIDLVADGKTIGAVPVQVRVLPFALPAPKTNYDRTKSFRVGMFGSASRNPRILKNLAEHNTFYPMGFPSINVFSPEQTALDLKMAKECGIATDAIFAGVEEVGVTVDTKVEPKGAELRKLENLSSVLQKTAAMAKKELGHTNYYSYGVDEGGPTTIRRERRAWKMAHDNGGKIMVSSQPHKRLIYNLDYFIQPGSPSPRLIENVRKFHEMDPAGLCGWYANPHSGPENPDYFRRTHGFQSYKSNYDFASNYCWWRNNWNDMATPYEENLRGLVIIYAQRDTVIDTLAWEGVREGVDDVKYASYLKDLALEATKSTDGNVLDLGRRTMAWLAYTDEVHADLNTIRMECIVQILQLRKALNKGN